MTFRAGGAEAPREITVPPVVPESAGFTLLADFSEFQPDVADAAYLNWSKAAIFRALYGTRTDNAWYGGGRRAALHAGGALFTGIYQYLVASESPAAQARAFSDLAGDMQPGEVYIVDYEEGAKSQLTGWYNEMLALGHPNSYLWTYTGENFGAANGALPVEWIAAYGSAEPASPHTLWQFTSSYPVPGVGRCDCSVYRGTVQQLAALAYQPPPAPRAWSFGPVRNLQVTVGRTSVAVTFDSPSGFGGTPPSPAPGVARYEWAAAEGAHLSGPDIPTYPRYLAKNPDSASERWQEGGFASGRTYTMGWRAMLADGSHSGPWVTATVTMP